MKYILTLLLFFEVLFGALLCAPIFEDKKEDPDALSRSNLDMVARSPAEMEAKHRQSRRNRWIFKSVAGLLLIANSAGIVVYIRRLKQL